ncbi:DUF429 domain-containing protein [Actinophytocola sp.]|uniref:DUF429 domain-containing protein n=1 Tax=Actinophytocola sp. TaxID=1872138 RepID=UPI002D7E2B60|nr:DUF429 domain-containing protein [Actinophytocola sp.]HET9139680.1 DUF429 domain-containing protein [Actinophytocola sp.]
MRTVGVDLAAEPRDTAIAVVEWRAGGARVVAVAMPADDETVVHHAEQADKVGIDCPLGWPDAFIDFLNVHRDGAAAPASQLAGMAWRRSLAYRRTDEDVRSRLGLVPLSVATDRIGLTAMRAARLQQLLIQHGHPVDRAGVGLIVEVYPAAGLKHWSLAHRRYKGGKNLPALGSLVDNLTQAAPWLRLGEHEQPCRRHDHVFDAVIAALLARAAALGLATSPPAADRAAAGREGWIALPTCTLDDLAPGRPG